MQIEIHFVAQVTGERGSLGGLGVPNTVEEATVYQVITYDGHWPTITYDGHWSTIHIKEREKKGQLETE